MKIAMLTTVGQRCGIAAYSAQLVASLRALPDTDVEIVPIAVGEQPASHYEEQARALNAPDVDVVHIQHEFSFWGFPTPGRSRFAELRRLIERPVVLTAHTTLALSAMLPTAGKRKPWRWLRKKRLLANRDYRRSVEFATFDADAIIVHTEAAQKEFAGRGLKEERLFVVPMGVPDPLPPSGDFRERYALRGNRVLTLFGYITSNKGYELVLEILATLPRDVVFVIAGGARLPPEQKYVDHLRRRIALLRGRNRVIVTGYLPDEGVADAMQATDIALVPHTQATNSYSVTLPLSHGRATLASDLACFREMAARGDCLELFRSGDKRDLRRKLVALLDDPPRREQLAANASRYSERFRWNHVAAATREVYRAALNGHRS